LREALTIGVLAPADGGVDLVAAEEKLTGEGARQIDGIDMLAVQGERLDLVLAARRHPDERATRVGGVDRDAVGVAEVRGVLGRPAPLLEQLTFERELVDEVRSVAIGDEQRARRRPGDVARHELAVAQAELLRRRELADDLALGRQ